MRIDTGSFESRTGQIRQTLVVIAATDLGKKSIPQTLESQKEINRIDFESLFEKWWLIYLVVGLYYFVSFKGLVNAFPDPPPECGRGSGNDFLVHLFFAGIATIIISLKVFLSKLFDTKSKIILLLIILIPLIISIIYLNSAAPST